MREAHTVRIGTAGWTIPRAVADRFPAEGSGLERYASRFNAAEINTTFYRPHKPPIWARWAAATPPDFRFAVKAPKAISHERRLLDCEPLLVAFIEQIKALGERLGPMLVQLPPSLAFEPENAATFFDRLRQTFAGPVVCEPRHASWFEPPADQLLASYRVARAAADPSRDPRAATPGGWAGLRYFRLHGSPRMYFSAYGPERLIPLAQTLAASDAEAWVIFDNTASGAAAADALALADILTAAETSG